RVRDSGQNVRIDGPCMSACTLVLSTLPVERICVTQRAVLGFHAPWTPDGRGRQLTDPESTRQVLATYPEPVQSWIVRHGGLTRKLIMLRGKELSALYPRCV